MNTQNSLNSWKILGPLILGLVVYFGLSASWPLSAQIAQPSPRPPKIELKKPAPATVAPKKQNNGMLPMSSTTQPADQNRLTDVILLLKEENRRLRLEIDRLKAENADLKAAQQ